jgi:hypothetical protein
MNRFSGLSIRSLTQKLSSNTTSTCTKRAFSVFTIDHSVSTNITKTDVSKRQISSLVSKFEASISELPMREAVRYTNKNMKWSASELKKFVDSHANALLEQGFVQGERILLLLPESAEKHVTLMAAAKIGLHVYDVEKASEATLSVQEMRDILTTSAPKAVIFETVSNVQDNLLLMRKSIPEFFYYDDSQGQSFHSKHWPSLEYFIHTGFDIEMGCLNYKHMFLKDPLESVIDTVSQSTSDTLPLLSTIKDGKVVKTMTQKDVLAAWSFVDNIIKKQYFETE